MENYEQKYKEALERARISRLQLLDIGEEATEIEYIFPELKESDDEDKIMKELLYNFIISNDNTPSTKEIFSIYGKTKEDVLAWIEKQNKQKIVIHKFRVGDVITSTKNSALKYKIKEVGILNELGEYDYIVEDVTDNQDYKGRIHNMAISKVDTWGVLIEEKPVKWNDDDETLIQYAIDGLTAYIHEHPDPEFGNSTPCEKAAIKWLKSLKEKIKK